MTSVFPAAPRKKPFFCARGPAARADRAFLMWVG